jgi:hypothetical protein
VCSPLHLKERLPGRSYATVQAAKTTLFAAGNETDVRKSAGPRRPKATFFQINSVWLAKRRLLLLARHLYALRLHLLVKAREHPPADDTYQHRQNRNRVVIKVRAERLWRREQVHVRKTPGKRANRT